MSIEFTSAVPQFTVPDVVKTAEYYRDVLGFQIAGYWNGESVSMEPSEPPVFGIVWRDKIQFFFSRADDSPVRTGRAEFALDAYIRITGVDELATELRERGADIIDGPEDRVYNQRELVVSDCNGLVLCFGEEIGQSSGESGG
ncbi:MAG TPA: VOC family protein [Pyrinomonadaceae bacterium]|nr:VOC family protein [Pyrinomonadaceae bacterium]